MVLPEQGLYLAKPIPVKANRPSANGLSICYAALTVVVFTKRRQIRAAIDTEANTSASMITHFEAKYNAVKTSEREGIGTKRPSAIRPQKQQMRKSAPDSPNRIGMARRVGNEPRAIAFGIPALTGKNSLQGIVTPPGAVAFSTDAFLRYGSVLLENRKC